MIKGARRINIGKETKLLLEHRLEPFSTHSWCSPSRGVQVDILPTTTVKAYWG
ncbi:MAG: hypothetical protein ABID54_13520 [Pseudomonadota bacterium]